MLTSLETAKLYFQLSNKSDFTAIEKLFTDSTTYTSQTTGTYKGNKDIITMQKGFHGKFSSLEWRINTVDEVGNGTILFDYDFTGKLPNGEIIKSSGIEYVTVENGKIQHIEVKNKP